MEILILIIAFFIPPLAVFMTCGICKHFWINLLLTILGYFPGVIHAFWFIGKRYAHA